MWNDETMNSVKITEKDGEYILYANGEEASHAQINIFPEVKNFDWNILSVPCPASN